MNLFHEAKSILDKDGKVNPLGPYGKQKLTGRETSAYFRRNKVKPGDLKKAVEVALDLGGAMDIASKEIKKFFGDKILKAKEVQNALQYANEETFRDDLNDLSEKFKPYNDKQYPRCVDFYIQFRGGKGDRITSEENKKDFEKAKKMIDAYCKSNKIKQKPVYSTPQEGSSAYKVGLMIDKSYSKTSDYDDGKDLQPLYVALSKLKTAEDHGGGWSVAEPKGLGPVKEETDLSENFRKLARHGMGTEQRKDIKVGRVVDFYDNNGNKREGKIIKVGQIGDGYTLKDNKDNKVYKFKFHDRFKAKELLKKKDKLSNIIKKNTIKKGKFAGYMTDSVEEAQQGARQSVMDTYRNIWEEDLQEEMITYRVKKMHPAEKKKFEQSGKMMGLKVTMNTNKQDTLVVMSGTKKKLRDFDSVARGKSSYGDPSTVMHFDEK